MNYETNIINLNYGSSYISGKPIITIQNGLFTFDILSNEQLGLNIENTGLNIENTGLNIENTGIISISEETNIGEYNINVKYIVNNDIYITPIKIIIKPNLFYDLNNISNTCKLIPIINPINNNYIFSIDNIDNITIDSTTGIITCTNLDIKQYSFTVILKLNNIVVDYFINFMIKPEIYYSPNTKIINYGEISFSDKPIINLKNNYIITSKNKIDENGILDFNNYDVGTHKIIVNLTSNSNKINISTYYNLIVKPIIKYPEYVNNEFCIFTTDVPFVSQTNFNTNCFNINNNTNYFSINSNTGVITVNAPAGIYYVNVEYSKNMITTTCNVKFTINPVISYNNKTILTKSIVLSDPPILSESPILNDKTFSLINNLNNNITIDSNSGILTFNNLEPNFYNIGVKYIINGCSTDTTIKVYVYPSFNINKLTQNINHGEQLQPITIIGDYNNCIITTNNKKVIQNNNILILDNFKDIGNYSIDINVKHEKYNNIFIIKTYNFSILPFIKYQHNINYGIYNELIISDIPIIYPLININTTNAFYLYNNTNNNIQINSNNGQLTFLNMDVGEYIVEIHYKYMSFDVKTVYTLIVKPLLIYPEQYITYLNNNITGLIYLPSNGSFKINTENQINESGIINGIENRDVGTEIYNVTYTVNNISTTVIVPIHIIKKKLSLNLVADIKYYDGLCDVKINTVDISNIIIDGIFETPDVGINKNIIIKSIILPDYLDKNYYTDITNIKGTIIHKIIEPEIISYNKIYDGTTKAVIDFNMDFIKVKSYNANFKSCNIGYQEITIDNIVTEYSQNYILSSNIYTSYATITKKIINISLIAQDKIYDGTNSCVISLQNIKDNIYVNNINAIFTNDNIGCHEIQIIDYKLLGLNHEIHFDKVMANIYPKIINIDISAPDKIYDSLLNTTLIFNTDFIIESYTANFVSKTVGYNKLIKITNIILENKNYIVNDTIINGNILPKLIEFNFIGNDKIYDGSTSCDGDYNINIYDNDNVKCVYTVDFKNYNVGINKVLVINNLILSGKDAKNYKINLININTPTIMPKELIPKFICIDKTYDKTVNAFIKLESVIGLIKNESVKILSLESIYDDYNIGSNKQITITNIILDTKFSNYFIKNTSCLGNILPRKIFISFKPIIKNYDETTQVEFTITNITNHIEQDTVYVQSYNANFIDTSIGTNKIVNVKDIILNTKAHNYICENFTTLGTIL